MDKIANNFEKLYKKTSTGAIQTWEVTVVTDDDEKFTIVTRFGQNGGKIQESREVILEGKNIGRSNETTPYEQAKLQAEADWTKQLKKGYVKSFTDAMQGKLDAIIEGGIAPMLAHKFSEQGHKIKYPALVQPKLDGHRCISQRDNNGVGQNVGLWSRTRKPITSVPHINRAAKLFHGAALDGELYNHEYHNNFEELSSLIRQEEPKEGYEKIQYHVYDIPQSSLTNYERNKRLQELKPLFEGTPIHIVETLVVNNEDELMEAFDHFIELGYEGCIVRNMDGLYVNKRSYDLQKVKEFNDDEFEVVGVKTGKGKMSDKAIFMCLTKDKLPFDAKMKGKLDDLKQYVTDPSLAIGKMLTVQYQGYSNYKIPRFPVGLRFREDI